MNDRGDTREIPSAQIVAPNVRRTSRVREGLPYPLGATWDGLGVNFAIFSANATKVELCLFDPSGTIEIQRLTLPENTHEIFHGFVPGLAADALYGFRAYGPFDPENGHRFNPNKLLADPYARAYQMAKSINADIVLVDTRGGVFIQDIIRVEGGQLSRPILMDLDFVRKPTLRHLCDTYTVRIYDWRHFLPLDIPPAKMTHRFSKGREMKRKYLEKIACGQEAQHDDLRPGNGPRIRHPMRAPGAVRARRRCAAALAPRPT